MRSGNFLYMSRLAKQPIEIPSGVTVTFTVPTMTVKGPKGELKRDFRDEISIVVGDKDITITPNGNSVFIRSLLGTYGSHIRNMMVGVTEGYKKDLEVEGVGYRWALSGKKIEMQLGFSHPVIMEVPEGIDVSIEKSTMSVSGIDKEAVGSFAAKVRSQKKPEPYKGKGIRYVGEYIRRKQGKKAV